MSKSYRRHGYSYGRSVGKASSIGYLGDDKEEEIEHNPFYKRRGRRPVLFLKRTKNKCSLDPGKS
jgi:hypothetical protein